MQSTCKTITTSLVIGLISVLYVPLQAVAGPSNQKPKIIRVFGDSLVDNGNLLPITWPTGVSIPPLTRYDRGRFSNGRVAVEFLSEKLKTQLVPAINGVNLQDRGINWGIGGSTTYDGFNPGGVFVPGLVGQVGQYGAALAAQGAEDDLNNPAVFIIWTAHNNYYIPLYNANLTDGPDELTVVDALADIVASVDQLYLLGARKIVVANMPDLGLPPICQGLPPVVVETGVVSACDQLSEMTNQHNSALSAALEVLEGELTGLSLALFDVRSIIDDMVAHPVDYGFSNVHDAGPASGCLFEFPFNPTLCTLVNFRDTEYLWWDEQHPTEKAHKILGDELYDLVVGM